MQTKWFGFSNGTNTVAQVSQIERSPHIIAAWHCAERQGPRVNITWQCRGNKRGGRLFWSLIHPSPVTNKGCRVEQCKDDFPRGDQGAILQCHNTAVKRQRRAPNGRAVRSKSGTEWMKVIMKAFSCRNPGPVLYELWEVFRAVEPTLQCLIPFLFLNMCRWRWMHRGITLHLLMNKNQRKVWRCTQ